MAVFAAMALALVLAGGSGTAQANILGLSASATTVDPQTNAAAILTADGDEGDGDVRFIATGGDFEACTDGALVPCDLNDAVAGVPTLEVGPNTDIDFTVDDTDGDLAVGVEDADAADTNTDTLLVTWGSPQTGPASVSVTAIQDNVAKSVIITVRGTADTVEIAALTGESTSTTSCQGTTAHVIESVTASAGGQAAAFLCILVKDSSGTRIGNSPVILSTTDGTLSTLTVTTGGTGQRARWDHDNSALTGEVSAQLTSGTSGSNGDTGTVTASSGGKSATVDVMFGGNPAACTITTDPTTVQTGGSATVTIDVDDSSGGPVADGVTVAVVQTNPGSGANAAILDAAPDTVNGVAQTSLIAAIPGAIALGASSGPAGEVISCTGSVTATGTVAPPSTPGTPGAGGFTGTAPASGSIGLLVTDGASDAAGLITALGAAGCTVESLAVLEAGVWKVYINGAPDVVNANFPASLAATTPFFVRCA